MGTTIRNETECVKKMLLGKLSLRRYSMEVYLENTLIKTPLSFTTKLLKNYVDVIIYL